MIRWFVLGGLLCASFYLAIGYDSDSYPARSQLIPCEVAEASGDNQNDFHRKKSTGKESVQRCTNRSEVSDIKERSSVAPTPLAASN